MRGKSEKMGGSVVRLAGEELVGAPDIADALSDHVAVLDRNGIIIAVNATWKRLAEEDKFRVGIGANYFDICQHSTALPLPTSEDIAANLRSVLDGRQKVFSDEYPWQRPGRDRWFNLLATALADRPGAVISHREFTTCHLPDGACPKNGIALNGGGASGKTEPLFDSNANTERGIIEAVDLEKQRFAVELHENLCQFLVGISLLGNALDEELLRLNLNQAQDARQIASLAKDAVLQVRGLVKQLSPMPLGQGEGLVAALEDLAEQAESDGKIKCSFHAPRGAHSVEPAIASHLFRIAQEAVYNAIKHAKAKRLSIRFSVNRREIVLTVRDNGIGFTPQPNSSSGIGLQIMNSRARAIRATLEFRKLPVRGTAVVCTLPKK